MLTQEEIDGCREAFLLFDKDRSGSIDVWELKQVLNAMGQKPSEEELFQMISEIDENMTGSIDFSDFLKVLESQKCRSISYDDESDMIDAFVACGGEPDKTGSVRSDTLIRIIKSDFGLTIDIEEMINKVEKEGSGSLNFSKFKLLLS
jgi:calmodulin